MQECQTNSKSPPQYREANENFHFLIETHTIKTLGLVWSPIQVTVKPLKLDSIKRLNRRRILICFAIFDFLVALASQLANETRILEKAKTDWDATLPSEISKPYSR